MNPIEPTVQLARVLADIPPGAELHGCTIIVAYALYGETIRATASTDCLSRLGAQALMQMGDQQSDRAEDAANLPTCVDD